MSASNRSPSQPRRRPIPRSGSRAAKLLLLSSGILVALSITEVALRVAGFTYFNPYVADRDLGHTLRPNAEGWWQKEGRTYVKINSHGFRDREHTIAKPPGTYRIAVLGDSYVEAFQVPLEKTFSAVMEQKLQECPPLAESKVEVLSFGVSGFSTARELILLQKRVWQYSPDEIVLLVTPSNDIRDNSRALNEYSNQPLPYFVFKEGTLKLDDSLVAARNRTLSFRFQQSSLGTAFSWMQNQLRLLGLFYTAREAYKSSADAAEQQNRTGTLNEPGLDSEVYREPVRPEWEDAWRVTEQLIVQMRDEVRARGAKFLVVTGSTGKQVNPDPNPSREFMDRLGVQNLFYPEQRIKSLGDREGFSVLNLAPLLQDIARRDNVFLHGSGDTLGKGHWNETGHQLAGELIAGALCER
jgi:hypothetical protein